MQESHGRSLVSGSCKLWQRLTIILNQCFQLIALHCGAMLVHRLVINCTIVASAGALYRMFETWSHRAVKVACGTFVANIPTALLAHYHLTSNWLDCQLITVHNWVPALTVLLWDSVFIHPMPCSGSNTQYYQEATWAHHLVLFLDHNLFHHFLSSLIHCNVPFDAVYSGLLRGWLNKPWMDGRIMKLT
jgi:hypothetical protein